jgi:hypothetical protein
MAKEFSKQEWQRIREVLEQDPDRFGFPRRVYGSILLGSFNIRKLGTVANRDQYTWDFLAHVCKQYDLLSVQEIQDNLGGLRKLKEMMGERFAMIVSDKAGAFPGEAGLGERLGFIYNWSMVTRGELATDITYDRSKVLNAIARSNDAVHDALADYGSRLRDYESNLEAHRAGDRATKPRKPSFKVKMPTFITFIRPPFCAGFEVRGHPDTQPFHFLAVNAHLYFGNFIDDRRQEFNALMAWITGRVQEETRSYHPNFVLLGDLNLDFDDPSRDRSRIESHIKRINSETVDGVSCNFPFLDVHRGRAEPFRTNARLSETFDQIGLFFRDSRFPTFEQNSAMPLHEEGPDYGVFDFANLFAVALQGVPLSEIPPEERKAFIARFEHKVSDHLPLWFRLPLPKE